MVIINTIIIISLIVYAMVAWTSLGLLINKKTLNAETSKATHCLLIW